MAVAELAVLFTDIEGSTRLWEQRPEAMADALARHDALLREAIEQNNGQVVKSTGDGVHAVFEDTAAALVASLQLQHAVEDPGRTNGIRLKIRCGIHVGNVERRANDYFGPPVNRAARIMSAAYGGQILVSQAVADRVAGKMPAGVSLKDLGAARLRDLSASEHLYQLVHASLREHFPPLRTLDARPNNLPIEVSPFVGRTHDIASVGDRLGNARLVTITGPGGTGKTRVALRVAAEAAEAFEDGVFFVELAAVRDPTLVLPTIAHTMGLRESDNRALTDVLLDHIRSRQLLLVLDNFEQVIGAASDVVRLLAVAPRVKVMVTSREALRVSAEVEAVLQPLPTPSTRVEHDVAALIANESVALFAVRAAAVHDQFRITERNAGSVAAICRLLDGLPLAIELAAARIRVSTPETMVRALSSRLQFLRDGPRDLPARQRTLRSTIDWSYELLSTDERTLFRRLSVIAGGATVETIGTICRLDPRDDVLCTLEGLVAKSLVQRLPDDSPPRFGMLETVREFAYEQLIAAKEADVMCSQHQEHFLHLAQAIKLNGADHAVVMARVDSERENLRAAFEWSIERRDFDAAQQMCSALQGFWLSGGHFSLGRGWCAQALSPTSARSLNYAYALKTQGVLAYRQGDYENARSSAEASLALFESHGDTAGVAASLLNLGNAAQYVGDYLTARQCFEKRLAIERNAGNPVGVLKALNNLANLVADQNETSLARSFLEESLSIARGLGAPYPAAVALLNLGCVAVTENDLASAARLTRESLGIWREIGLPAGTVGALLTSAEVAIRSGDVGATLAYAREGVELAAQIGDRRGVAIGLELFAACRTEQGQPAVAATLWAAGTTLRAALQSTIPSNERAVREARIARARIAAGEAVFLEAWRQGASLSVEDVVARAVLLARETNS